MLNINELCGFGAGGANRPVVVGTASVIGTSITIPTHAVGDLILLFVGASALDVDPPAGSTFTDLANWSTGYSGDFTLRAAFKFATTTSETSGTWASATHILAVVVRGVSPVCWVGSSKFNDPVNTVGATGTNVILPIVKPSVRDGSSLLLTYFGATVTNSSISASGYTNIVSQLGATPGVIFGCDDTTTDTPASTFSMATSDAWVAFGLEIKSPDVGFNADKIVYCATAGLNGDDPTTFTDLAIGNEAGRSLVVLAIDAHDGNTPAYTNAVTCGGVAFTKIIESESTDGLYRTEAELWAGVVPTGSTATVVVDVANSTHFGIVIHSFALYGLDSTTPTYTNASNTTVNGRLEIDTEAATGSVVIWTGCTYDNKNFSIGPASHTVNGTYNDVRGAVAWETVNAPIAASTRNTHVFINWSEPQKAMSVAVWK